MVTATPILSTRSPARPWGPGLSAAHFRRVAAAGLGNGANAYAHSMIWFRDHLYVGTTKANLANRALQIAQLTPERLEAGVWPVPIPNTYWENDLRAEIWRFHPPSGEWKQLYVAPMVEGIDGFPVPLCVGFRSMVVFQGPSDRAPALYVPTWGSHQTPSSLLLRSEDGEHFEFVSEPGAAVPEHKPRSIRGFVPFKGYLFASPVVGQARFEPNVAGHMVLLACTDPVRGDWQRACAPGFGDPNNVSVFQMAVFHDHLYAVTMNINEGFQLWRTDAEGPPPFRWQRVLADGAYRGRFNQLAMSLCPFGDHLYIGTAIQNCSFDYDYNVGPAPPEVLRIDPDGAWDVVAGEPRITPDGLKIPLSGLGPAFNNPFAGYLWSLCAHDGWLYAGTGVWTVFLRYRELPADCPPRVLSLLPWKNRQTQLDLETLLEHYGGCHLWRTRDGTHWLPVTQNGFNNCFNIGVRTQVSTPHGLFVGTANPFGPEVAVQRVAGWRYEQNAAGGFEIWQGSHDHDLHLAGDRATALANVRATVTATAAVAATTTATATVLAPRAAVGPNDSAATSAAGVAGSVAALGSPDAASRGTSDVPLRVVARSINPRDREQPSAGEPADPRVLAALVEAFFQQTAYRQLGFWHAQVRSGPAACENLIDELLAWLPERQGPLVELSDDGGATAAYVVRKRAGQLVSALLTSVARSNDHAPAREEAAGFARLDGSQRRVRRLSQTFHQAVWIDGLLPARPTLAERLEQCQRLLVPGGRFAGFAMLPGATPQRRRWFRRAAAGTSLTATELRIKPDVRGAQVSRTAAVSAVSAGDTASAGDAEARVEALREQLVALGFEEVEVVDVTRRTLDEFRTQMGRFLALKGLTGEVDAIPYREIERHLLGDAPTVTQCLLLSGRRRVDRSADT